VQRCILWDAQLIGKQPLGSNLRKMATAAGAGAGLHPWGWADETRHAFDSFQSLAIALALPKAGHLYGRSWSQPACIRTRTRQDCIVRTRWSLIQIPYRDGPNGPSQNATEWRHRNPFLPFVADGRLQLPD
jgi:hypothetical protein